MTVKTIRRIGGWLAPYRGQMILAMVLTGFACLFNLPVPLLVQALVDQVVTQGHWDVLPWYASLLFGVFAVQTVLAWPTSLAIGRIGQGVVRDLRHRMYERLQLLGMAYFDKTPSGAIISRVMDDVGAIQIFVTSQSFTIVTNRPQIIKSAGEPRNGPTLSAKNGPTWSFKKTPNKPQG